MARENPKKDRKRGGDITGRGPARSKLGDNMQQGSNGMHASEDNIKGLMIQGSKPMTHKDSLKKLGQLQQQK